MRSPICRAPALSRAPCMRRFRQSWHCCKARDCAAASPDYRIWLLSVPMDRCGRSPATRRRASGSACWCTTKTAVTNEIYGVNTSTISKQFKKLAALNAEIACRNTLALSDLHLGRVITHAKSPEVIAPLVEGFERVLLLGDIVDHWYTSA